MTFKNNWEKSDSQHSLPTGLVIKMISSIYPDKTLKSHQEVSDGCANLNIKFQLEEFSYPLILRIYLRDKSAVFREQNIAKLLRNTLPAPQIYFIGEMDGYCFAIAEFMSGQSLREVLLGEHNDDAYSIMHDVGKLLAKIASHEFSAAGFFDKNLEVKELLDSYGYVTFVKDCLEDKLVLSELPTQSIVKIKKALDRYGDLFPGEQEKSLVHADFDPSNIFVDKVDGKWQVTGILDWEFSFAGSILCDIANMLRYAYQVSPSFQENFLAGLNSAGISLPTDWYKSIMMLNILSLLDCLKRADPINRPNQCADICELIEHILVELD